ncbi:MAG: ABC transporter substrate-binding protein [Actinobacteria bacterium]|nr:MAG: ABC transporter substrate-binding protein [Actinomycetota bacterium]
MPNFSAARLSRRGLFAAGGAAGLAALLAACGGGSENKDDQSSSGEWTFTDDRGKAVTAKSRPERVVAYIGTAAALHDFGVADRIVGVFGPTKKADGSPDTQAGDLDINKVEILGNAWGEFNIEKYASLRPQLLITHMYEQDSLWYVPDESKDKIEELAPTIGLSVARVSLGTVLQRYAELAAALGADLNSELVANAKNRFDQASEALRKAASENKGIRVMAASAAADMFYVSDPKVYPDLSYYQELGVEFVVPDSVTGGYFENLSWENADKYEADLILLDNRTQALQPKDLEDKPTWKKLPAAKAGQIVPWLSEPRFSYTGCAPHIEELAKALSSAKRAR